MSVTEREKGATFERLMKRWLKTDPRYNTLKHVWLWEEFPARSEFGGKDTGIDLVAQTESGDYWAIQCKFYDANTTIDKPAVDSFLSTSSGVFTDSETMALVGFSQRLWISTTDKWNSTALDTIRNQQIPVNRIGMTDLEISPVDWDKLENGDEGHNARTEGKSLREHQLTAISKAKSHFDKYDRGKLIMACGTGKTYTSLKLIETLTKEKGLILFMVPSIALLGQALNDWSADCNKAIKAVCICSDSKSNRNTRKSNDSDSIADGVYELALPASTNSKTIAKQLMRYRSHDGLVVVFSTYQSIDAVSEAQKEILKATNNEYGVFDFIVCDEAHRTTGAILKDKDESNFTKIHKDEYVQGRKRLYMTATPRLYGESVKSKAAEKDALLCSMDDESIYGKEFFRVNFAYAVEHGLLTDYKVLVLTVNSKDIPANIRSKVENPDSKEYDFDDTSKLIGLINGLAKQVKGDDGKTWEADPRRMQRALAFCSSIGDKDKPGTSRNVAEILPVVAQDYYQSLSEEDKDKTVLIEAEHIDGSMDSLRRNQKLQWLKEDPKADNICKVLCNVRCLSEGVDVPALDAVLFLSARNSQVDVVQSVGRIMRNFKKGTPDEKKYGYIILPIVIDEDMAAEDVLDNNEKFSVVWSILNALRSHDDNFNAKVNQIALNKRKDDKVVITRSGLGGFGPNDTQDDSDAKVLSNEEVARQLEIRFGEIRDGIYAKLVEKCGDRLYWENWAKEVGEVAKNFIVRITDMVLKQGIHKDEFDDFLKGLRNNINESIDEAQAIEMLAQHLITRPVFDALFAEYHFVDNNAVSKSMQGMIALLEDKGFSKDLEVLDKFYESVKRNVSNIDNLEGKQSIIKSLYEKFFKGAFPKTVEQLGIVYTPVECVDFIIHSVNDLLKQEFNTSLTEENVHILDPFTGTGTFITRLLQSGLIKPEDMERKYLNEIHCNEIVLLAYYIADVNIESVFHDIVKRDNYLPYDGICLTDTFQLNETGENDIFSILFPENSERLKKQKKAPVRVVIGNPPYSAGQKSANDNAQNLRYTKLEKRLADTYVKESDTNLTKGLYNSYIKAFRWATDRIKDNQDGGIVAFISPNSLIDGNSEMGVRKCWEKEYDSIYVLNLKGNQNTSGETSKREGGKIFGSGSRQGIAIYLLVKNPNKRHEKAEIHYCEVEDYKTREEKLKFILDNRSISSNNLEWQIIKPNDKHDWINQRDGIFDSLLPIASEKKFEVGSKSVFIPYSLGIATNKDIFLYDSSKESLVNKVSKMIEFYNQERELFHSQPGYEIKVNKQKITWTDMFRNSLERNEIFALREASIINAYYRPYFKQKFCYQKELIQRTYQQTKIYPLEKMDNICICVSGIGVTKSFSCIITDLLPDLEVIGKSQCFPLYWYEDKGDKKQMKQLSMFEDETNNEDKYIRHDGVSDWILKEICTRYGNVKNISKEDIFYYVYGLLHSEDYRTRFADDLKKSLPRIPIVEKVEDFWAFSKAGRQLAELHLNYETVDACPGVTVNEGDSIFKNDEYEYYSINEKMRFRSGVKAKDKPDTIVYNGHITVENIPAVAYDYIVNGKSAIEWIMERYTVSTDKDSLIRNDCNDWSKEHGQPRYILDLLLSVINVSVQTVEIVKGLPKLNL